MPVGITNFAMQPTDSWLFWARFVPVKSLSSPCQVPVNHLRSNHKYHSISLQVASLACYYNC